MVIPLRAPSLIIESIAQTAALRSIARARQGLEEELDRLEERLERKEPADRSWKKVGF